LGPLISTGLLVLSLAPMFFALRREGKGYARPLTFLLVATVIYYVIPMVIQLVRGAAAESTVPILLVSLGNVILAIAYAVGVSPRNITSTLNRLARLDRIRVVARRIPKVSSRRLLVAYVVVGALSTFAFFVSVGGIGQFFCALGQSQLTTAGRLYLIWGMLLPKSALLALVPRTPRNEIATLILIGLAILGIALVLLTGVRLFLLMTMVEIALVFHIWKRPLRPLEILLGLTLLLGIAIAYGEYRIETDRSACAGVSLPPIPFPAQPSAVASAAPSLPMVVVPSPSAGPPVAVAQPGFGERLISKLTNYQYLEDRYTKNFVDALDVFVRVYRLVPAQVEHLRGATYVRILVQPIPRFLRPETPSLPPVLAAEFTGVGTGTVFQLWTEAYLNFGVLGVAFVAAIAGWLLGRLTRHVDQVAELDTRAVYMALLVTAMLLLYRGSFVGALTLALMDALPVLAFLLLLKEPSPARQ
jgi:hypothetical protein